MDIFIRVGSRQDMIRQRPLVAITMYGRISLRIYAVLLKITEYEEQEKMCISFWNSYYKINHDVT